MGTRRCIVIGGGIGGLTVALALRQLGFTPRVFEQARQAEPLGAGIQLSPNATRILLHLGLGPALRSVAVVPQALESRSFRSGQQIFAMPIGDRCAEVYGAPYYLALRSDLHAALAQAVGPQGYELGSRCTGFSQDGTGVRVELADGRTETGDLLIGADGLHSTVRTLLFGAQEPRFSGQVAFRGLIPAERVAGLALPRNTTVWWGPGRHFVHYFVASGRILNFVAVGPCQQSSPESWSVQGSRQELLGDYAGWHPTVQAVIAAAEPVYKWALHDREPLSRWGSGRVTLLGDAAHPMLPFQAQGAAQAIEDAMVLARCLARDGAEIPRAIAAYEQLRQPRTRHLQAASRKNERLFHLTAWPLVQLRDRAFRAFLRFKPEVLARWQGRIFEYDALSV